MVRQDVYIPPKTSVSIASLQDIVLAISNEPPVIRIRLYSFCFFVLLHLYGLIYGG